MTRASEFPSPGLDGQARAELLCYLVAAQLLGRARSGSWLRTDHLVESMRTWAGGNGATPDWFESVRLGNISRQLAETTWAVEPLRDADVLAILFTDGWRLDFRSPIVRGIHDLCAARLMTWDYEA
ncbi:hypothetical protein BZM27_39775 [Paraburkholderia steynii]|uniref:Uncharacterized protein n=1 Tax=Paraburkholderia steynii TaxID=1245441 RepID=A0A4R0XC87_9BURK|nr:hypothetical protein BZM27_39775 [Paraburkholderia steynii]